MSVFVCSSIIMSIIMGLAIFFTLISEWDWIVFWAGVIVIGRVLIALYRLHCKEVMNTLLDLWDWTDGNVDDEMLTMLRATSSILIPPKDYIHVNVRGGSGCLTILTIALTAITLVGNRYGIAAICLISFCIILLTSIDFFYTGNNEIDLRGAIYLYSKAAGLNPSQLSQAQAMEIGELFIETRDWFYFSLAMQLEKE